MVKLKVGDRVKVLKNGGECLKGEQGTIIGFNGTWVAIRFDCYAPKREIYRMRECEPGYGCWAALCEFEIGVFVAIPKKKNNLLV